MSTPTPPHPLRSRPAPRPQIGLWVWAIATLVPSFAGAAFLGILWLAALDDPDGSLLVAVFAWAGCGPAVILTASGIAVAIVAGVHGRRAVVAIAAAALACHVPLALTLASTGLLGVVL